MAASIGPFGGTTFATGRAYSGKLGLEATSAFDTIRACHMRRIRHLMGASRRPDVIMAETISNYEETKALCSIYAELSPQIRGCIVWTLSDGNTVGSEASLRDCVNLCLDDTLAESERPIAVGINCSSPTVILEGVRVIRDQGWNGEILLYPNSGEKWDWREGKREWVREKGLDTFSMSGLLRSTFEDFGVKIVGGCCRVTPKGIKEIAGVFDRMLTMRPSPAASQY